MSVIALPAGSAAIEVVKALSYPNPSTDGKVTLYFESSAPGASASALSAPVFFDPDARAELSIYTTSYRLLWRTAVVGVRSGGNRYAWEGRDLKDAALSNGTYLFRARVTSRGKTTEKTQYVIILR